MIASDSLRSCSSPSFFSFRSNKCRPRKSSLPSGGAVDVNVAIHPDQDDVFDGTVNLGADRLAKRY